MCETTQRLLALLRIVEQGPGRFDVLGDDALLDAWFGVRSRLAGPAPGEPHRDAAQPAPL
ncbi:MAG TPA: hypothetical protein VFI00_11240 [Kribbella sp.]|nr:hypothetical protein [Kribbella sp.]